METAGEAVRNLHKWLPSGNLQQNREHSMIYRTIRKAIPATGFKGVAMAYAGTKLAERLVRRNKTLRRGMSIVSTASWAVPLGLLAWRHFGPRPAESTAGD